MKEQIDTFFDAYARRFNAALQDKEQDVEGTAASFEACFLESTPGKVICSRNDDAFKAAIPAGFRYYRSTGLQSMKIGSKTLTPIDELHTLIKIRWQALYIKKEGSKAEIGFDVHYLVKVAADGMPRIFAYITGDEQQLLEAHGIEPYL